MQNRYTKSLIFENGQRIKNVDIKLPKIRAEFFVRLYSVLGFKPEVSYGCYEFYIVDNVKGLEFSAGLTDFGPGYFAKENSEEMITAIEMFDQVVFNPNLKFQDCKMSYNHDFGTSNLSCENGVVVELDFDED